MSDAWDEEITYQLSLLKAGNGSDESFEPPLSKLQMIEKFEPPDWLIDGMLQRRFIYALTGQTGHAKTAIALLIAVLAARGGDFAGHQVEQGSVGYLVGENPDDVTARLIGQDEIAVDDPIYFYKGIFDIEARFEKLQRGFGVIGGIDLLIVDTSAAYFNFPDENSNADIGKHARMLRRLTELPGEPCVLVLCHPVKYVTDVDHLLPRGGGAFLNEMDGNLTLRRLSDAIIELHHNKIRGPGFEPLNFRLERVTREKLVDSKGRSMPTVRAAPISNAEAETEAGRSYDEDDSLLRVMLKEPDLTMVKIAERCGWYFADGQPHTTRVQRTLLRLDKDKLVKKPRHGTYELTETGKAEARKIAIKHEHRENFID
jgi:hypothetical protein